MNNKNVIARVVRDAQKDKRFVSAFVRLKSNGRFAKINGQVKDVRINRDGQGYVVFENFFAPIRQDNRRWQSVLFENIIVIKKDKMVYR